VQKSHAAAQQVATTSLTVDEVPERSGEHTANKLPRRPLPWNNIETAQEYVPPQQMSQREASVGCLFMLSPTAKAKREAAIECLEEGNRYLFCELIWKYREAYRGEYDTESDMTVDELICSLQRRDDTQLDRTDLIDLDKDYTKEYKEAFGDGPVVVDCAGSDTDEESSSSDDNTSEAKYISSTRYVSEIKYYDTDRGFGYLFGSYDGKWVNDEDDPYNTNAESNEELTEKTGGDDIFFHVSEVDEDTRQFLNMKNKCCTYELEWQDDRSKYKAVNINAIHPLMTNEGFDD